MTVNKLIIKLYNPVYLVIVTVSLSFLAWLTPDFGFLRKGFYESIPFFSIGGAFVIAFYCVICLIVMSGYILGRKINIKTPSIGILDNNLYYFLTILSLAGVAYAWSIIISGIGGLSSIFNLVTTGNANALKYSLYEDYQIGFASLRYVSIISCSLSLFRFVMGKRDILIFPNIFSLLLVSLVSSRVAILFVFLITLNLLSFNKELNIKPKFIMSFLFLFFILFLLNYSRNYGFYDERGLGFISSGISEIITYLGTPFQGSLAAGEYFDNNNYQNLTVISTIESSLTTNSSLLYIYENNISFVLVALTLFFYALTMGILRPYYDKAVFLVPLIMYYCFAEFWRVYLFSQGIIITLLLTVILSIIFSSLTKLSR